MSALGIIFSNIHDENLAELTRGRTMGSVPFGGRYRLIDFALSNMVNSKITKVGVITKSNYQSLMDHLGSGKDWDLARKNGGIIILPPFGAAESEALYKTRLEALKGIRSFLTRSREEYVVMCDCDSVYRADFNEIINLSNKKNFDIIMMTKRIEEGENLPSDGTFVKTDKDGRITQLMTKPDKEKGTSLFLNVYILKKSLLENLISDAAARGYKHFTGEVLAGRLKELRIYSYDFEGYFASINSLAGYYEESLALLKAPVRKELFGDRGVYTKVRDSAPTKYGVGAVVNDSLIADGCVIEGEVYGSVLFRGVKVGRGTVIKNSILFQDAVTGENCELSCVIADKNVTIRDRRTLSGCELQPYFIAKGIML